MSAHGAASEAALVASARAGETAAFGALARRYGGGVRALLRRMGAPPALADDIAQDAFLAAFESLAQFRGEGSFEGWLKRIAARAYVKRRRREALIESMAEPPELAEKLQREPDARLDLDAALAFLGAHERVAVSLCCGAGFTHEEAAALLNLPLGTVKSQVKRGLEKLRARLAPEGAMDGRYG